MNVFKEFHAVIAAGLEKLARDRIVPAGAPEARFAVEPPRDPQHGDVSTNAAMVLAKAAGMKPRALAEALRPGLEAQDGVISVEIAGPGFVNIRLSDDFWRARLGEILSAGEAYGDSAIGQGRRVNVEYVSANPTGPMHVGHGRGAVVGDALAGLLEKAGFAVTREYYVNDAGVQVEQLAYATYFRYLAALGGPSGEEGFTRLFPDRSWEYRGEYLVELAERLRAERGDSLADLSGGVAPLPPEAWLEDVRGFAVDVLIHEVKDDLQLLGIEQEEFVSERALQASGAIDRVVASLKARDLVYTGTLEPPKGRLPEDWEPRPQLLFRATRFGDDVDRPLMKSDGSWTYFASDIAYHLDKFERGFDIMIDVWGADHKGYVKRMQAAVEAVSEGRATLDVLLCNLVNLSEGGKPVKMSKRAGTFVTLRDVVDQVGKDVFRFIMLTRGNEATLDFDLAKAVEQSRDNPVFYVQYAHARACSVMRNAAETFPDLALDDRALAAGGLDRLAHPAEIALVKQLAGWPRLVETAADAHEPYRVAYFLGDVASAFHGLWTLGNDDPELRFVRADDAKTTRARLALARAAALVIASGLKTIGVEPVEEMR